MVTTSTVFQKQSANVPLAHNQNVEQDDRHDKQVVSPSATLPPTVPTDGNERRTPVLQGARARVARLETAISAVGQSNPTFPALH